MDREEAVENGEQALRKLLEGNRRFTEGKALRPNQSRERLAELSRSQKPFAAIMGCADSRVPAEILFDVGLGDLFVVRVAGNVVDADELTGSLEYAVEMLGVPLIMVLGHERCGAVTETIKAIESGGEAPGHIGRLVETIRPAVEASLFVPGDRLDNAVRANVAMSVSRLRSSEPILRKRVREGTLKIVGARFDLDMGCVEMVVD